MKSAATLRFVKAPARSAVSPPRSALVAVLRLLHPFPSVLLAGLTVALVRVADADAGLGLYLQLGLGMLLYQFSIGITNDVVDADDDAVAKAWKALPRGIVSRRAAVLAAAGCAGTALLFTAGLDTGVWLIGLAGWACGMAYDLWLKRTRLSWLPYSIAFPLVPVWVYLATDAWRPLLWWVFPLGALLGLGLHLANQTPDVEADRRAGVRGTAQTLGAARSRAMAVGLVGAAGALAVGVLAFESSGRAALAATDVLFAALIAPRATRYFGRDGLFGLLCAATAVLAVVFLSAV